MANIFLDGNLGKFDQTNDPTGNPPSDWNVSKETDALLQFDNVNKIEGIGSFKFRTFVDSHIATIQVANNDTFTLPIDIGSQNFVINWGDGSSDLIIDGSQPEITHTYTSGGIYDLTLIGTINNWRFNNSGDRLKQIGVKKFGDLIYKSTGNYYGCSNLNVTATDKPKFIGLNANSTNSLVNFFRNCTSLVGNPSFNDWNVSGIIDMNNMFRGCVLFNQPLNNWDVSSVELMNFMFSECTLFNQNIGNWDVSSVINMTQMFGNCRDFNNGGSSDINNWITSSITNISLMFVDTASFNQPIGNWDISSCGNLFGLFARNTVFNQNLNNWNTGNIVNMNQIFDGCTAYNQPLNNWNVEKVTTASLMLTGVTLSTVNYDNLLISWESQNVKNNVIFSGGNSKYTGSSAASAARGRLISDHTWTITDGGIA